MKKLYELTAWKEELTGEGENKVKKYTPHKFFIRKPNRALYDDADLFYAIELSQSVKAGILTRAQLATKFSDEGGTMSQSDKKKYVDSYLTLADKETEYQKKTLKKEEERSEQDKKEIEELIKDITDLRYTIQEMESNQQSVFDFSAESRARNKTVLWWVFNLAYLDNGTRVFGNGTFEESLGKYDKYEEDDDQFMINISKKLLYLISFWYAGRTESKEDFDKVAESIGLNKEPKEEVKPQNAV